MKLKQKTNDEARLKSPAQISRRGFAKDMTTALIAAPFAARAQAGPLRARQNRHRARDWRD